MSPSANWQALTVRHTETVRQPDDCPLEQVPPRWDGCRAGLRAVADLLGLNLGQGREQGGYGLSQARCPMARDFGTRLIEPKTPFYSRFHLLALVLPNAVNNPISGRLKAKAASL